MSRIEFEWHPDGFLLDLDPVADQLGRFPPLLEAAALDAIFALCARSIAEFEHIDPSTGRMSRSREAQFLITSLRRSDSLTIYNIQIDWLGTSPEVEAYVLFSNGDTILRKEPRRSAGASVSHYIHIEEADARRQRSVRILDPSRLPTACGRVRPESIGQLGLRAAMATSDAASLLALPCSLNDRHFTAASSTVSDLKGLIERDDLEAFQLTCAFAIASGLGSAGRYRALRCHSSLDPDAERSTWQDALWLAMPTGELLTNRDPLATDHA